MQKSKVKSQKTEPLEGPNSKVKIQKSKTFARTDTFLTFEF